MGGVIYEYFDYKKLNIYLNNLVTMLWTIFKIIIKMDVNKIKFRISCKINIKKKKN